MSGQKLHVVKESRLNFTLLVPFGLVSIQEKIGDMTFNLLPATLKVIFTPVNRGRDHKNFLLTGLKQRHHVHCMHLSMIYHAYDTWLSGDL